MLAKSRNFTVASCLNSRLARYFWICPYDSTGQFNRTLFGCYFVCTLCLISLDFSIAFNVLYRAAMKNSVTELLNKILAITLDVFMNFGLIVNMWCQSTRKKILQRSHASTHEYNLKIHVFTLFSMVLTIAAVIARFFERLNAPQTGNFSMLRVLSVEYLWFSIYSINTLVYFLIAALYGTLMNSFIIQIQKLTEFLESTKPNSLNPEVLTVCIRSHYAKLAQLSNLHKVYSKQMFFISVDVFGDCVFNGYYVITYAMMGDAGMLFGIGYGAGIVVKLMTLFVICTSCSNAQSYTDAFNHELFKIVISNDRLCRNEKLVMVVQARRTVTFTAGGFVTLGKELIVSMLAGMATYLVMLVQCSQLRSSKPSAQFKTKQ